MSARRAGIPFVVAAPSGTGKTSVCRRIVDRSPRVVFSVSHTTRAPRDGERDGVAYHFVDDAGFQALIDDDQFVEWAEYNGNRYGTSRAAIEGPLSQGTDVILEIEVQGARQLRRRLPEARFVFLLPPTRRALERRLRGRGTDGEEEIARRLRWAEVVEIDAAVEFDYAVVNDDLERCVDAVLEIMEAERKGDAAALRRRYDPAAALERFRRGRD